MHLAAGVYARRGSMHQDRTIPVLCQYVVEVCTTLAVRRQVVMADLGTSVWVMEGVGAPMDGLGRRAQVRCYKRET